MPDSPKPEKMLKAFEVAAMFRVNVKTVTRWAKAGKIPHIKTPNGKDLRFRESEVRALLNRGEDDV